MNEEKITENPVNNPKNNKSVLAVIIVLVVLFFVGAFVFYKSRNKSSVPSQVSINTSKQISMAEVNTHNSQTDCWTTINGGVYDITKFIPQHKGGERILAACGVDATDLFTGKSDLGRAHTGMASKILSSMQIGVLQN